MTRPGTGQGRGTPGLFQLGVEGGEFVRYFGVARRLNPFLGKILGKPDAPITPLEARIFLDREHDQFLAAVRGGDGDRLTASPVRQGSKSLLYLGFRHADHFHTSSVISQGQYDKLPLGATREPICEVVRRKYERQH